RKRPTSDLDIRQALFLRSLEIGLNGLPDLSAPQTMSHKRRMRNSEALETHCTGMNQVPGTSYGLIFFIDEKKVPTLLIAAHTEKALIIEFPRLNGTVLQVDAPSQALDRSKTLAIKLLVNLRAPKRTVRVRLRRS